MGWYTRTFSLNNAQDIWKWDGTGEGSFFERATDRVRWIFIYTFNPRALCSRPPLVLRTIVLLFQTLFSRRAFNPILFSLRTFKSHHRFFLPPPFIYFYLSKNSRQWKDEIVRSRRETWKFRRSHWNLPTPNSSSEGKTFIPSRGWRWTPLKLGV